MSSASKQHGSSVDDKKPTLASQPSSSRPQQQQQQHVVADKSRVVQNSLLAGSCSGMVSTLTLYPLDVIRTKMQAHHHGGPLAMVRQTLAHGGVRALYTGLTLPLGAQIVYKGTVFSINSYVQQWLLAHRSSQASGGEPGRLTGGDRFVCGFVGGFVNAALFVTPVEFVRNQLIAQHSRSAAGQQLERLTSWQVMQRSVKLGGGLPALWRGITWSVARDGIGCGCFFYTMAWWQKRLTTTTVHHQEPVPFPVAVFSGAMAGLSFWVVGLPLDTIKTWVQSADLSTTSLSTRDKIRDMYARGGVSGVVQGLNRGWQVAYSRGIPSAAITISVYSMIYGMLEGEAPI